MTHTAPHTSSTVAGGWRAGPSLWSSLPLELPLDLNAPWIEYTIKNVSLVLFVCIFIHNLVVTYKMSDPAKYAELYR